MSSELQVQGACTGLTDCMQTLLQLAAEGLPEVRTHALNIVRALVRHAALHEHVAPHVGGALLAALHGFDGDSWAVRDILINALIRLLH